VLTAVAFCNQVWIWCAESSSSCECVKVGRSTTHLILIYHFSDRYPLSFILWFSQQKLHDLIEYIFFLHEGEEKLDAMLEYTHEIMVVALA
jgi:hypothetical protein